MRHGQHKPLGNKPCIIDAIPEFVDDLILHHLRKPNTAFSSDNSRPEIVDHPGIIYLAHSVFGEVHATFQVPRRSRGVKHSLKDTFLEEAKDYLLLCHSVLLLS